MNASTGPRRCEWCIFDCTQTKQCQMMAGYTEAQTRERIAYANKTCSTCLTLDDRIVAMALTRQMTSNTFCRYNKYAFGEGVRSSGDATRNNTTRDGARARDRKITQTRKKTSRKTTNRRSPRKRQMGNDREFDPSRSRET